MGFLSLSGDRIAASKSRMSVAGASYHREAVAWAARVTANGGTAGTSLAAVSTFCKAIDAAGIRDKFYRLNLFCGGTSGTSAGLAACLVPLYLTPDTTVTNLFQQGTDMTSAVWLGGGNGAMTRTVSSEVGPLGYGFATKLITPTTGGGPTVRQMYQLLPIQNRQVTFSVWLKTNTGTKSIQWMINGEYLDAFNVTSTWTRYTKTYTSTVSANDGRTALVSVVELNDAGHILAWGMQCEYGPTATSYNQPRYGNATDANNGPFAVGDYAETGASGGLWYGGVGTNVSKRLDTGIIGSALLPGDRHCSAYEIVAATTDYSPSVISGSAIASMHAVGPWTTAAGYRYRTHNTIGGAASGTTSAGMWLGSDTSSTASVLYKNGAVSASTSGQPAGASGNTTYQILGTSAGEYSEARLGGYSIGLSLTSTQAAAFYTAMQAFQTALGRSV